MKRTTLFLLVLLARACVAASAQTSDVNVRDYGAKGDSVTDDTAAFSRALAAVEEKGGTVNVPSGNYLIKTHITIPPGVTLEGTWKIPPVFQRDRGSTLLAVEGKGSETGTAFITLNPNSAIKGLTVFYPDQKPDDIQPYPWCVAGAGGDNMSIVDCLLVNPYQAVDFGSRPSGRHYIRNLYGQPLRRGIFVDQCYDIGRIENVHFWPFWVWDAKTGIDKWLYENGEAFIFARTDWEYVFNTFTFGYKTGYKFIQSQYGSMNGNLLGIGGDACDIAVLVEQCQKPGLLFTNGEFVSINGRDRTEIVVRDTSDGIIQFQNCSFWGPAAHIAKIGGKGHVSFNNCNLYNWGYQTTDWKATPGRMSAMIQSGGSLSVMGCNFSENREELEILKGAKSTVFVGNTLSGPMEISFPEGYNAQIGLNATQPAPEPPKRPAEEKGAIVVDDADGFPSVMFNREWLPASGDGNYLQGVTWARKGSGTARATFRPMVPKSGRYEVWVYVSADPMNDHAKNAPVRIVHSKGSVTHRLNTYQAKPGWKKLGVYGFVGQRRAEIVFTNDADGNVAADAVKLVPIR